MDFTKIGQRNGISYKNTYKQVSDRKINLYHYSDSLLVDVDGHPLLDSMNIDKGN